MSDNGGIYTNIGFNVDQASVDRAKAAVASLGGTFAKTAADVEKSKAIENASKSFIQMALAENDAAAAALRLNEQLKALGATDKEIEKVVKALDKEIEALNRVDIAAGAAFEKELALIQRTEAAAAKKAANDAARASRAAERDATKAYEKEIAGIQRADAAAAKKAANDASRAAKSLERAEVAARRENTLRDAAKKQAEIDIAEIEAYRENAQRDSAGSGGLSLGTRITRAGAAIRNLPSVQIPGAGFGTDAVGNLARVSGALVEVAGKSSLVATASSVLTPLLGAQAAATVAAAAPVALLVGGFVAIGLAIKALVDSTSTNVDRINTFADSQRQLSDKIVDGLTSKDAQAELDKLNERRERETATLSTLQKAYNQSQAELTKAAGGLAVLSNTARLFSGDEQALADQIEKSQKTLKESEGEWQALSNALDDGSLAANDAKIAEQALAEERTKNALASADAAAKELQAQQKSLGATEEQNKERLKAIENEKAVIDKQIEVLSASGVTSEEVTSKIAALNDQLGLLGKESEFISKTGLEASRQSDARKKAAKDAEEAEKKVEAAQKAIIKLTADYATKQVDIARANANKLRDIEQNARDKEQDTDRKFYSDMTKITENANQDRLEAERKAADDEYEANLDTKRKLEDLRNDALASEEDAVNDRNFLAQTKIREGLDKANKAALKEAERGAEDRARATEIEDRERLIQLELARNEQVDQYRKQQFDNRENLNRQRRDALIAKNDQLQEAQIAYNRELEAQQAFLTQYGIANAAFYAQQVATAQQAAGIATGANGGSSVPLGGAGSFPSGSFPAGGFGGLRPISAPAAKTGSTVNLTIYAPDEQAIYNGVKRLGLVD